MLKTKDYNSLDKDSKALFLEAHAPKTLRVGEVLVRKYRAFYNSHLKTWIMPSLEELNHYNPVIDALTGKEIKVYKNFRYQALNRSSMHWIEQQVKAGVKLGDNRGQYKDINGNVHSDVYKQGNFFFKVVKDLQAEIEFLSTLFIKAEAPEIAVIKDDAKEAEPVKAAQPVEVSEDSKTIYIQWEKDKLKFSKKEFAKEHGISTHILNKIIKENEASV